MTRTVTTLPVTEKNVGTGNWDTTRAAIDRVVIHTMVGTAASAASRFYNSASKVSAHYGVLLDGSIWHWVDEDNTAYHAGNYAMNQRSIGIEHEDNGDYNGIRPDILYATSAKLVRDICQFYQIPIDRTHIIKHSQIVPTGCPDALDIERIVSEANGIPSQQSLIDQLRADRDKNWNLYQQQLNRNIEQETIIAGKQKTIDTITTENLKMKEAAQMAANQHIADLGAVQALTDEKAQLYEELVVEQNKSGQLEAELEKAKQDLADFQASPSLTSATVSQLVREVLKRFHL